jgi:hypothetical protein
MLGKPKLREGSMVNAERQMPEHVKAAYRGAVDNILFLKRQQWLATNYVLLLYVAVFLISAHYFSRTDVARTLAWGHYNCCVCYPLVDVALISTLDRDV